jgi:phosphopantetheine adenylyltransferase
LAFSEEMHLTRIPATLAVDAVETVFQSPSASWISVSDTVERALMITLSGSMNGWIAASGVDAWAVSQSAGTQ